MEYWPRKKYGCRPPCYDYKKNLKGIKRSCDEGIGSMTSPKKKRNVSNSANIKTFGAKYPFKKYDCNKNNSCKTLVFWLSKVTYLFNLWQIHG